LRRACRRGGWRRWFLEGFNGGIMPSFHSRVCQIRGRRYRRRPVTEAMSRSAFVGCAAGQVATPGTASASSRSGQQRTPRRSSSQ
jgi:hypothetical protein